MERNLTFLSEEMKMVYETHKILGDDQIRVCPTCVRVPVSNCHSESILVETERKITVDHLYAAQDAGTTVNPASVENQMVGCLVHGTSRALLEEVVFTKARQTRKAVVRFVARMRPQPRSSISSIGWIATWRWCSRPPTIAMRSRRSA
jgi:aspartate-semialdehyde dehydrogenase